MIKKLLYGTYLKSKHLLISISGFNKFHLMDRVIYKEQDCFISNMVSSDSNGNQLYHIFPEALDEDGKRKGWYVPRSEFKKKICWFNIKNGLTYHYKWWRTYWYEINLREIMDK